MTLLAVLALSNTLLSGGSDEISVSESSGSFLAKAAAENAATMKHSMRGSRSSPRNEAGIVLCRAPIASPTPHASAGAKRKYYKCHRVKIIIVDGEESHEVEAMRYLSADDHRDLIVYEHDSTFDWGNIVTVSQSPFTSSVPWWSTLGVNADAAATAPPPGCAEIECPHPGPHKGPLMAEICRIMLGPALCTSTEEDDVYAKGGGVVQPLVEEGEIVTSYVWDFFAKP